MTKRIEENDLYYVLFIVVAATAAPPAGSLRCRRSVKTSRPSAASAQTRRSGSDSLGLAAAFTDLPLGGKPYGCGVPERSSAPHSPNGGVSEDATPQFHLCVGVSVYSRDDGSAVLEFHVPLSWRPDLADAHAPLHPHTVRAGATHPHFHPPGPEQGQTAGPAAASPAARTHRQVSWPLFIPAVERTQALLNHLSAPAAARRGFVLFENMLAVAAHRLFTD